MVNDSQQTAIQRRGSIKFKINMAIGAIFLAVICLLFAFSYYTDRRDNLELAIAQVRGMNLFYFDSLNTLMLTDGIAERHLLRDKLKEIPGIIDIRVVRHESINRRYGAGSPEQAPRDELDRRGVAGESIVEVSQQDGHRVLSVIEPIF
jgi:methyl-accepting chemotaxis protein